jgi:hypothetical protein
VREIEYWLAVLAIFLLIPASLAVIITSVFKETAPAFIVIGGVAYAVLVIRLINRGAR